MSVSVGFVFRYTARMKSLISALNPVNVEEAMADFFRSGCAQNPQFKYSGDPSRALSRLPKVDYSLLEIAESILRKSEALEEKADVEMFSFPQFEAEVLAYMQSLGLSSREAKVERSTTSNISLASVVKPRHGPAIVRLSSTTQFVGSSIIPSVCSHEIGTHLLRMLNDDSQVWASKRVRRRLGLSSHIATEEGLAVLNGIVATMELVGDSGAIRPLLLTSAALRYWAVVIGSRVDFVTLFRELERYIPNNEVRFRYCVRTTRGGAACGLDQSYLIGAVDLLRHRQNTDFQLLYAGKISRSDLLRISKFIRREKTRLPPFLATPASYAQYKLVLERIAEANGIEPIHNHD